MNERHPPIIKQYTFGDLTFRVETPVPMREDARFEVFASEPAELPDHVLLVRPLGPDRHPVDAWPVITERNGHEITVYMRTELLPEITVANLFITARVADLLPEHGACLLHASYVLHEGKAILFSAPSGTGKSTQAALWEKHLGAEIINGDKVIVSADGERPNAYGGPIAGTSRIYRDLGAPIRAIVYLRQGKTTHAELADPRHAFMDLYSQVVKRIDDPAFNEGLLPLLEEIAGRVPVLEFSCLPDVSAVDYLLELLDSLRSDSIGMN